MRSTGKDVLLPLPRKSMVSHVSVNRIALGTQKLLS